MNVCQDVLNAQHQSLDATDAYASAWSFAIAEATAAAAAAAASADNNNNDYDNAPLKVNWGGRGKGGRGTGRRTFQPRDIVVENVNLEYMNDTSVTGSGGGGSRVLLSDAYLKLLSGRVYTLIGRNGGELCC